MCNVILSDTLPDGVILGGIWEYNGFSVSSTGTPNPAIPIPANTFTTGVLTVADLQHGFYFFSYYPESCGVEEIIIQVVDTKGNAGFPSINEYCDTSTEKVNLFNLISGELPGGYWKDEQFPTPGFSGSIFDLAFINTPGVYYFTYFHTSGGQAGFDEYNPPCPDCEEAVTVPVIINACPPCNTSGDADPKAYCNNAITGDGCGFNLQLLLDSTPLNPVTPGGTWTYNGYNATNQNGPFSPSVPVLLLPPSGSDNPLMLTQNPPGTPLPDGFYSFTYSALGGCNNTTTTVQIITNSGIMSDGSLAVCNDAGGTINILQIMMASPGGVWSGSGSGLSSFNQSTGIFNLGLYNSSNPGFTGSLSFIYSGPIAGAFPAAAGCSECFDSAIVTIDFNNCPPCGSTGTPDNKTICK